MYLSQICLLRGICRLRGISRLRGICRCRGPCLCSTGLAPFMQARQEPPPPPSLHGGWPPILATLSVLHRGTRGTSQWTRWGSELSGSSLSSSPTYAPLASPWWGAGTGLARGGCSSLLPDAVGLPRPLRDADTALVMPQDLWKVWKCSCSSSVAGTRAPSLSPPLTSAVTPGVQAMTSSCCCHSPGLCDTSALTIMRHK